MLTATTYIYEMCQYIVADVARLYGSAVHYQFGHPMEIIESLQDMTKAQAQSNAKYPLITLFTDITQDKGEDYDIESKIKITLMIIAITEPQYKAAERLTVTMQPILYPLYWHLMDSIIDSGYFANGSSEKYPKHKQIDRFYWGKSGLYGNTANIFDDFVDGRR